MNNKLDELKKIKCERQTSLQKKLLCSEEGREWLELLAERILINVPGDSKGQDLYNLGKTEGQKEFIRLLIEFEKRATEGLL